MNTDKAANELREIRDSYLRTIEAVKRKRAWRESEKAMTIAGLHQKIEALQMAHRHMTGRDMEGN